MAGFPAVMTGGHLDPARIRRHFSRQAEEYEGYAEVQRRVADRLLQLLLENGPVAGLALDIGSGSGYLLRRLSRTCPGIRPIASDIAHGMTRQAASRLPGKLAVDADAQALPVADGSLPLVLSASAYQWVEDLPRAFAEAFRVLRPGGRFAFALFGSRTLHELRDSHRRAAVETGRHPSHVQDFPCRDRVVESLAAAGFDRFRLCMAEEWEFHPDLPALLRQLKRIGAANAALHRPPGLASRQVMARLAEHYEAYRRHGLLPATYEVIYVLAKKGDRGG